jgi:hypothetical protein
MLDTMPRRSESRYSVHDAISQSYSFPANALPMRAPGQKLLRLPSEPTCNS